jgi:putative ABC transport system permease protein
VLLFAVAISMLTGILFGLAPALHFLRPDLATVLKEGGGGSFRNVRGQAMRNGLVATEIALSAILLTSASLAIRFFVQLTTTDRGLKPEKALSMGVVPPPNQYKTIEQRNALDHDLLQRVSRLPGVEAAAIGLGGGPYGGIQSTYSIAGQPRASGQHILVSFISSDYLRTLGIPLKSGRAFTPEEVQGAMHVALVNEAAAKLWKAGQDPASGHMHIDFLGQTFKPPELVARGIGPDVTVVGVVGDTRSFILEAPTQPEVYVPSTLFAPPGRLLVVRTYGDPTRILDAVRAQVRQVDRNLAVVSPMSIDQLMGLETARPRSNMALFSAFAALGLTLAAIGNYCVVSYNVTQRVHEIGVRMALGASRGDILRWVMRTVVKVTALGLLIGLCASFAVERIMHSNLFGKNSLDAGSAAAVALVLSVVALLAGWLPAHRAGKLNPVTALRREA